MHAATIHGERTLTDLDFARLNKRPGTNHLPSLADLRDSAEASGDCTTILAVTDLAARSEPALSRAACLAAEHHASLELLYAAAPGEPPCPRAASRLAHQALQLGERHGLRVRTTNPMASTPEHVASAARGADLLVMGAMPRERSLLAFVRGQWTERLLRRVQRPMLVVRQQAEGPYQRLLVAIDFTRASRILVERAFALNGSARIDLFHAISTINERKLRSADVPEHVVRAYRQECTRYARDQIVRFTDSTDARRNRVSWAIGRGDPARQAVVQQQHSGAELLVVGKHPASAMSDFVFGSVAQRVLRHAAGDVLIVPHNPQAATKAAALERLGGGQRMTRRVRAGASCSNGG